VFGRLSVTRDVERLVQELVAGHVVAHVQNAVVLSPEVTINNNIDPYFQDKSIQRFFFTSCVLRRNVGSKLVLLEYGLVEGPRLSEIAETLQLGLVGRERL
jgi:hypothetical protein